MISLKISTPVAVVVADDDVFQVRAEDFSGGFGIRPGHADFLTALVPCVIRWRLPKGAQFYCAVRGGVLTVRGGSEVAIATRDAVAADDLARLERDVLTRFAREQQEEDAARTATRKLQLSAIRQLLGGAPLTYGGAPRLARREEVP